MKLPRIRPGRFRAPKRIMTASTVNSTMPSSAGLIKLARMARQRAAVGEHHRPGQARDRPARPHNSPLMKLASRPRNSPIGATAVVMSPSDRIEMSLLRANQHHRGDAAEEAAVERHAALPQLEDLGRVLR